MIAFCVHASCGQHIFTIAESWEVMEANVARRWSSLPVPSVQEMVKEKKFTTVPPRYVRSDLDKAEIEDEFGPKLKIPVVDVERLRSDTIMDSELEKLDFACREWGFFQLVNHGVDSCLLDKVKAGIQALFSLPMAEKKKLWQPNSGDIEGFGQAFVVSEEQKLDWGDLFYLTMHPVGLRKAHLFSELPLPFRDTLDTFSTEVKEIAKFLVAKMARALKIKPEEMEDLFNDGLWQSMRMNYYPPCPQPDQVTGLTPHSDSIGLTILLQVNEVEGLQIKKDEKWVSVKPLPNAFIVNVGDITEVITNGAYQSVEHQAMVNDEKERLSVAVFHSPGFGTEIGPARSLVERQNKAFFRRMSTEDYYNCFLSRELKGKSQLELMRM
ncbi:PREDICTED: protein SRG1-like [Tarenaya hassleriana]|uniref:protein SRG1-like n=1 Tax=Tarenaya hassleriana TaxID=28532 RepID=UPI00053C5140|nr:PREDICTED: protein SRG1-like [Tarenaya hassleriana]